MLRTLRAHAARALAAGGCWASAHATCDPDTWREAAGRRAGPEHYRFGDITRTSTEKSDAASKG